MLKSAYRRSAFKRLYPGVQKAVLEALMAKAPASPEHLETLMDSLGSSAAVGLSPSNQKLLVAALARGDFDAGFAASVDELLSSPAFVRLQEAEKEAVLRGTGAWRGAS